MFHKEYKQGRIDYDLSKFVYGAAGNMTAVRVGGNPIANYNYANGNLTWAEYNSQRITYGYTDNRLTTITNAAGPTGITYNDYGQVTKIAGVGNGGATYGYDYNVDNLDGAFYVINGANRLDATYDFPIGSNQATATYVLNNNSTAISKTTEVYNSKGLLEYVNGYGHGNITYVYDGLNRLKEKSGVYSGSNTLQTYSYRNGTSGTTSQIELDKYSIKGTLVSQYKYGYNASGNIESIRNAATNALIQEFQYDSFDRLSVEKNYTLNKTFTYAYNNGGNITSRTEKNLSTGAVIGTYSYIYDNTAWKDQLTSYNGKSIAYDAAGNPTSYLDLTLTWQNGKQLKTVANAKHGGTTWGTITMEYDSSGLRTKKSRSGGINTCDQYYYWQGNKLLAEQHGSLFLYYYYDETGVCGFNRAGADYYFQKNILGDIIAIYNTSGTKVGSYEYDAWGNTTVTNYTSDIIADWNPFRYRGYYQDQETGFYYLISRYYDPVTGRFISADEPMLATLGLGIVQGSNLYSYCYNNPIMLSDSSGCSPFWDSVGGWFKDHWKELAIGAAFIIAGAVITALTAGTGVGFMAAFGSALLSSMMQVGISVAISAGIGAAIGGITGGWEGALQGFGNGIASGFMWGGIFAGGAQILSGGFKAMAQLGANTSKSGSFVKVLTPNRLRSASEIAKIAGKGQTYYEYGGTMLKVGKVFIDVSNKTFLHMHLITAAHIPLGTILAGIIGGI